MPHESCSVGFQNLWKRFKEGDSAFRDKHLKSRASSHCAIIQCCLIFRQRGLRFACCCLLNQ